MKRSRQQGKHTIKLISAYIQPERLNAVKQALYERAVYKVSVSNALGCGQQKGCLHQYRGAIEEVTLLKKIRLRLPSTTSSFTSFQFFSNM